MIDYVLILLTVPYLACQAKKYSNAAKGWPTRQKLTQNTQLPMTFPVTPWAFSSGTVAAINGIWITIPRKATPRGMDQHASTVPGGCPTYPEYYGLVRRRESHGEIPKTRTR